MFNAFTYIASRAKRFSGVLACLTLAGSAVHAQPILTFDQALRLAQDRLTPTRGTGLRRRTCTRDGDCCRPIA